MPVTSASDTDRSLIEVYSRYVPAIILDCLQRRERAVDSPTREEFDCAVIFADISGFTPLTETFAAEGPSGAESLTRILNDYFGKLIDVVHAHGGDVVKFAGDAMTILWPVSADQGLPEQTLRASACALAIQAEVDGYEADGQPLSLRVAVGAGTLSVLHVGGEFNRWEFAIAGQPMHQVGFASDRAEPGAVVVSAEAWDCIAADAESVGETDGVHVLGSVKAGTATALQHSALGSEFEEAVKGYLPAAITRRIIAGQTDYLGELRHLTVLFINLPDLHYDTPLAEAQAAMRALQRALYFPYEGSINKLSVDDKGITLIAALGLPPFSHEDDPTRGVLAAIAMRKVLTDLGHTPSIGVTTGRIYCGAVGSPARLEYTIMGDRVNLAARLMQAAKGHILVDQETFERSQSTLRFEAPEEIQVKGKSQALTVYRPLGHRTGNARQQHAHIDASMPMIGREHELSALVRMAEATTTSQGARVALIEGEAGIGKSRLLAEFLACMNAMPVKVAVSSADAIEQATSYYAWQLLLVELLDLAENSAAERVAALEVALAEDPELLPLLPLLNNILSLDLPDTALTRELTGEVRAHNTQVLTVRLLQVAASQQPLVLIVDDVHWLDSASWALLGACAESVSPMQLVLLARPIAEAHNVLAQLRALPETLSFKLERLEPEQTIALVAQRLGATHLPAEVAQLIMTRAEGHPFFAEEIGSALRDAGTVTIQNGVCALRDKSALIDVDLPSTIEGIITSRIDRLEPEEQLTIKVASVIGRVFALATLLDVFPIAADREALPARLKALERLDLAPVDGSDAEHTYLFKHIITQQVAYDLMLQEQREALHQGVATWFERTFAQDLSPHYPILAHHWELARDARKALHYMELAAEQSVAANANVEAISFLDRIAALPLHSQLTPNERGRHGLLRGQALRSRGLLDDARAALEAALRELGYLAPDNTALAAPLVVGELFRQLKHRKLGVRRRQLSAKERERREIAASISDELFRVYFFDNDQVRLLRASLMCINLSESLGERNESLVLGYASFAAALSATPLHSVSFEYIRRADAILEAADFRSMRAWANVAYSLVFAGRGQLREAIERNRLSMTINKELGAERSWEESVGNLCLILTLAGEFANGPDSLPMQLLESGERRHSVQVQGWAHSLILLNHHHLQQTEQLAEAVLELQRFREHNELTDEITLLEQEALQAQYYARQGNEERLQTHMAAAAALLAAMGLPTQYRNMPAVQLFAEAAYSWQTSLPGAQHVNVAKAHFDAAIKYLRKFANTFPLGTPKRDWLLAKQALMVGDEAKRANFGGPARRAAQGFGLRYDELLAAEALARFATRDDERASYQRRATELKNLMGCGIPFEAV